MSLGHIHQGLTEDVKQKIRADQLALMYQALPLVMVGNMLIASLVYYVLYGLVDITLLSVWFWVSIAVGSLRLLMAVKFLHHRAYFSDAVWENFQLGAIAVSALLWSFTMVWMFPQLQHLEEALMILLFMGLHFATASSSYTHPKSVVIFIGITAATVLYELLRHPEPLSNIVALMYSMFLLMLGLSVRRSYRHNYQGLAARYEAKQKGEMLRGSEERLRTIINNAGELLIVHDHAGGVVDVNPLTCVVLGYARDELLGKHIGCLMAVPGYAVGHLESADEMGGATYESMFITANGEAIPVDICVSRFVDPEGNHSYLLLARDLRAKKAEERELRDSRQKLSLLVRSTPLAVVEWDLNLCISAWNPAAEKIFGYLEKEIVGKSGLQLLVPEEERDVLEESWRDLIQNGHSEQSTHIHLTKDGRLICCEWYHSPLVDDEGNVLGVASLAMDITQRVRAERAKEEAVREAEKASSAKSEFLSKMSHELRTPLNAIIGFSDLMRNDASLSEAQIDYMQEIHNAGGHLLSLVNEVLDLSRIEHGKITMDIQQVSVAEVLGTAVTMIRPLAFERQIDIGLLPCCEDIYVLGDKRRLTQIVINLLSNAVKYNRDGGRIHIHCEMVDDKILEIAISDTGIGIADEDRDKVFTPFERGGDKYSGIEGAGIGLMISRGLVERMGGSLTFESCIGVGSCFSLTMPLYQKKSELNPIRQNIA